MKKILSLLLALALLLSACGVPPTDTTPTRSQLIETTAPTETASAETAEPSTEAPTEETAPETIPETTEPETEPIVPVTEKPTEPEAEPVVPVTEKPTEPEAEPIVPVTEKPRETDPTEPETDPIVPVTQKPQPQTEQETDPETEPIVPVTEATEPETEASADPYIGVSKADFYAGYTRASSYQDAQYRSAHGLMSGSITVPGQYFTRASYQPTSGGSYLHNSKNSYADNGNTYIIVDGNGNEVMRIYRGGAYITLEEVAAYMYAFGGSGDMPANYTSKKSTKPSNSIWGEYLRLNHSYYSNNNSKYPYEPKLPGDMQYYEMDIGTTGTSTPGYSAKEYNNGYSITRGAARLVYARRDLNGNGTYEQGEVYVFYTHNHYNDFTEYLNYYGGWGETFGNITGGGTFDSKTDCNPTPYVDCIWKKF